MLVCMPMCLCICYAYVFMLVCDVALCVPCVMYLWPMSQSLSGSAGLSYAVAGGSVLACAWLSMPGYLGAYLIVSRYYVDVCAWYDYACGGGSRLL